MPMMRYEAQPGLGLAIRKYSLAKQGVIAYATARKPGPSLSDAAKREIDALRGMDIVITTTARTAEEGKALLEAFNFPFKK